MRLEGSSIDDLPLMPFFRTHFKVDVRKDDPRTEDHIGETWRPLDDPFPNAVHCRGDLPEWSSGVALSRRERSVVPQTPFPVKFPARFDFKAEDAFFWYDNQKIDFTSHLAQVSGNVE